MVCAGARVESCAAKSGRAGVSGAGLEGPEGCRMAPGRGTMADGMETMEGGRRPVPEASTLSTIAVQSGTTRIVIALLQVGVTDSAGGRRFFPDTSDTD